MDMNVSKLQELVINREAWHAMVHRVTESDTTEGLNWTELILLKELKREKQCFGIGLSSHLWEVMLKSRPSVSSVQSCVTLCDPMDCSTPGISVYHQLLELAQTHVHWVSDAIQPSHPLLSPSPPAFNLSQHQGLFQWVSSWHQVAEVLEFQLQHQSFQWIFRTDFL